MAEYHYELKRFDALTMAATRAAWAKELSAHDGEVLASPYDRILDWAEGHIDYAGETKQTFAYGIFGSSTDSADAIVELIYTKSGLKWLKLLDLHLSPSVDLAFSTQDVDFTQLKSIFSAGVKGTIRLTSTVHPSKVTKLYGRSGALLSFLKGVQVNLEKSLPSLHVSFEGRWLVFRDEGEG